MYTDDVSSAPMDWHSFLDHFDWNKRMTTRTSGLHVT